jgi:hypothetical protein
MDSVGDAVLTGTPTLLIRSRFVMEVLFVPFTDVRHALKSGIKVVPGTVASVVLQATRRYKLSVFVMRKKEATRDAPAEAGVASAVAVSVNVVAGLPMEAICPIKTYAPVVLSM